MSSLRLFSKVKTTFGFEKYLDHRFSSVVFKLRAGQYPLGTVLAKWGESHELAGIIGEEGQCPLDVVSPGCHDELEDVEHFLFECDALQEAREKLMEQVDRALEAQSGAGVLHQSGDPRDRVKTFREMSVESRTVAILGGPVRLIEAGRGELQLSQETLQQFRNAAINMIVGMGRARKALLKAAYPSGGEENTFSYQGGRRRSSYEQHSESSD